MTNTTGAGNVPEDSVVTFGSLFSGIGGIDLGLERAGMVCKWQVEIDDYANRVLEKHWPNVRRCKDVRTFPPEPATDWTCDVVCGGFPCQDISNAGKRAGIEGERSGLWSEFARVVRVLRPRIVIVENVAALLGNGLGTVLGDLAAIGYDAEWDCIPAESVGAPHERDRLFVIANAHSQRQLQPQRNVANVRGRTAHGSIQDVNPASGVQCKWAGLRRPGESPRRRESIGRDEEIRNIDGTGSPLRPCFGSDAREELAAFERTNSTGDGHWAAEPAVVRMVHGVPDRVDRIRGLGNAVVPQVAEWIGRRIMTYGRSPGR